MIQVTDHVYYVGALNPNLRVFDIIMKTDFGTSYNAYLIKGEKTALVEAVHETFCADYLEQIQELTSISDIDYVILNHTEPDHSGCLSELFQQNPNITVIATGAGIKNIGGITNASFKSQAVKDKDQLDLGGGVVLEFAIAPNLHWPDSMFTYLAADKVLFSCDVFGCHYCEPHIFDEKIVYPQKYDIALKEYYDAIFGPFKPFVLNGLAKIAPFDFTTVCTSHGPILRQRVQQNLDLYRAWSTPQPKAGKSAAIFYVSAYGYTRQLANALCEALTENGVQTEAFDVIDHDYGFLREKLEQADALLFGSPTINRDALKPIWDMLSMIDVISNKGKPCAVFGSYGWSGEACGMLAERLRGLKLNVIGEPIKILFRPTDADFDAVRQYAAEFATHIK